MFCNSISRNKEYMFDILLFLQYLLYRISSFHANGRLSSIPS